MFEHAHTPPPPRPHNHHIPLSPNIGPIRVCPSDTHMLRKKLWPNSLLISLRMALSCQILAPFSSLVLLDKKKKKDGTWRLSAITKYGYGLKTHQNCLLDFRWPLRIPRDVIWTNKHTIYIPICNEQPPTTLFEKIFFGFFFMTSLFIVLIMRLIFTVFI